ncbi:hypothetical protein GQ457_02G027220 [Hibiscus cannabinus]
MAIGNSAHFLATSFVVQYKLYLSTMSPAMFLNRSHASSLLKILMAKGFRTPMDDKTSKFPDVNRILHTIFSPVVGIPRSCKSNGTQMLSKITRTFSCWSLSRSWILFAAGDFNVGVGFGFAGVRCCLGVCAREITTLAMRCRRRVDLLSPSSAAAVVERGEEP